MKRQIIMCALLATAAIGAHGVRAGGPGDGGQRTTGEEGWGPVGMVPPPPPPEEVVGRMTRRLKLTGDQQAKIGALLAADRETMGPLLRQVRECRRQLHDAALAATFDEAAVRALAAKQAQAEVEVIVARERTRSRISALLTPQQRTAAEKLPPLRNRGERPGGRGECGPLPPPPCACGERPGAGERGHDEERE